MWRARRWYPGASSVTAPGRRRRASRSGAAWLHPHTLREAALDAVGGDVGTGRAAGEDLAGIHRSVRVEGDPRALHGLEVLWPEHPEHEVVLLEPDPVLARQRSAGVDRDLEDLGTRLHHPRDRLDRAIEQQDRMEIAIA